MTKEWVKIRGQGEFYSQVQRSFWSQRSSVESFRVTWSPNSSALQSMILAWAKPLGGSSWHSLSGTLSSMPMEVVDTRTLQFTYAWALSWGRGAGAGLREKVCCLGKALKWLYLYKLSLPDYLVILLPFLGLAYVRQDWGLVKGRGDTPYSLRNFCLCEVAL